MMKKKRGFPLFVSIPHSGVKIPPEADWLEDLDSSILMCDVDAYVDDLYRPAIEKLKIPFVFFEWHRYSLDVNRFSTDISKWTVENQKSSSKEIVDSKMKKEPSDIHWHKSTKGDVLIKKPLSRKQHKHLINTYFVPFHYKIKEQIKDFKKQGYQNIYFLDLHSMPSQGLDFHRDTGESRKEIVISDNEGRSCSKPFRDLLVKAYEQAGFEVALNWPYKGGAIIQNYGQPHHGQQALQIELNRKLYMDEETKEKKVSYKQVQDQLTQAMDFIIKNQEEGF